MTVEAKSSTADRAAILKEVKSQRKASMEKALVATKANNAVRKKVIDAMKQQARTVPEIANSSGVAPHEVLWHVTAMKKYDQVIEVGQDGGYYQYELTDEAK